MALNPSEIDRLYAKLNNTKLQQTNTPLWELINSLLKILAEIRKLIFDTTTAQGNTNSGLINRTYLTAEQESAYLPFSRELLPGTNITFDDSVPNERTVNASSTPVTGSDTSPVVFIPLPSRVVPIIPKPTGDTNTTNNNITNITEVTGPVIIPIDDQTVPVLPAPISGVAGAAVGTVTHSVGIRMVNGGSALVAGVKGYWLFQYSGTIKSVSLFSPNSCSITVDIKKTTTGSFPAGFSSITAAAIPALSSGTLYQDSTLSGWSKTVAINDVWEYDISGITGATDVQIEVEIEGPH